jgi:hypothetical protein
MVCNPFIPKGLSIVVCNPFIPLEIRVICYLLDEVGNTQKTEKAHCGGRGVLLVLFYWKQQNNQPALPEYLSR